MILRIRHWFLLVILMPVIGCDSSHDSVTLRFGYLPGTRVEYKLAQSRSYSLMAGDSTMSSGADTFEVSMAIEAIRYIDDSTLELRETSRWREPSVAKQDKQDTTSTSRVNVFHALASGRIVNIAIDSTMGDVQSQYVRGVVDQGTPVFPQGPVGLNYSWSQTTQVPTGESYADATTVYRVTGFMAVGAYDCAVIEYRGNMLLQIAEDPADSTRRSGVDRVTTSGKFYFAHREGFTVKQTERWEIDGDRKKLVNGTFLPYKASIRFDAELSLVQFVRDQPKTAQ